MTEEKKHWADVGYEGLEDAEKEYEKRYEQGGELNSFYLKAGETKEIVFETDKPLCFWEHQLNIGGNWRNWFTCRKNVNDGCIVCTKDSPAYVGIYLIRDMTGFVSKKSGQMKGVGRRMLFRAKRKTLKQIQTLASRRPGGLIGLKFAVTRSDDNSANCGDVFDFIEAVDLAKLPEVAEKPDLMAMFKPKSNEELKAELAGAMPKSTDDESTVPF